LFFTVNAALQGLKGHVLLLSVYARALWLLLTISATLLYVNV
jgi:hypothetical protein